MTEPIAVTATTPTEKYSLTVFRDGKPVRRFGRIASIFIAEDDSVAMAITPGHYSFGTVIANKGATGPIWTLDVDLMTVARGLPTAYLGAQTWVITRLAKKGCGCKGNNPKPSDSWA